MASLRQHHLRVICSRIAAMLARAGICVICLYAATLWAQSNANPTDSSAAPQASSPAAPLSGDSTQLLIVKFRKPDYPVEAVRQEIQGRVTIHLLINETGDVETAEAVSGNSLLTDAAIHAMKTWKFKPYIRDGRPVKVSTNMPYDFAFSGRVKDTPDQALVASTPVVAASPDAAAGPAVPLKVKVPPSVSQGLLLHKVQPVYPRSAITNRVQGTVVLRAIIGKDGRIKNLQVISGPQELTEAAIGAVEQWRYRPYSRNGETVEVETTINVNFTLSGR